MNQRELDYQSALYLLVWHDGLSIEQANAVLQRIPDEIPMLAKKGRCECNKCLRGLARLIDSMQEPINDIRFSA